MKKLSPTQIRVLRALAEPGVVAEFVKLRRNKGYFIIRPANHIRILTMRRLIALDLVGYTYNNGYWGLAYILPAGREYLEGLEEKS